MPRHKQAHPNPSTLWPANKKPVPVSILGVTDPDRDQVTITVLQITCNEPITAEDASGIGTNTAWLAADRLGKGRGRTYTVTFVASDGKGGQTVGTVLVFVPHDMRDIRTPT